MPITHDQEKLSDAILFFVNHTKSCGITKLLKLLFFLDFTHFQQTGRSVTGQVYRAWRRGPAPSDVWRELRRGAPTFLSDAVSIANVPNEENDRTFAKISPKRKYDGRFFSKREQRILDNLAEIYRDAKTNEMVEITHLKNSPWDRTLEQLGENAIIDYMLALDGGPSQLDRDEILTRLDEEKEEARLMSI